MNKYGIAIVVAMLVAITMTVRTSYAGTIEGYVYGIDTLTGDTTALDSARVHGVCVDHEDEFTVFTNWTGYYVAHNVSNGSWQVTASHPGYIPQTKSWMVPSFERYLKFYLRGHE